MKIGEIREYQCYDSYGLNDKRSERLIDRYLDKYSNVLENKVLHCAIEVEEIEYATISGDGGTYKDPFGTVEIIYVNKKIKCWGRGLDK